MKAALQNHQARMRRVLDYIDRHAPHPPLPEDQASRHVTLPLDAMTDVRSDARDSSIDNRPEQP